MVDPLLRLVPESLRPVLDALGIDAVIAVIKAVGGQKLLIPKYPRPHHTLVGKIGLPAVKVLASIYAGEYLSIPRAAHLIAAMRNRKIAADERSANALAAEHGLSERHIRTIRADAGVTRRTSPGKRAPASRSIASSAQRSKQCR